MKSIKQIYKSTEKILKRHKKEIKKYTEEIGVLIAVGMVTGTTSPVTKAVGTVVATEVYKKSTKSI